MSCTVKSTAWEEIKLEVNVEDVQESLLNIEKTIIKVCTQKLDKLNIIMKNLNVYSLGHTILVNDRYGVCKELVDIVSAFGFSIKQVDCGLRGKSYIIQDELLELLISLNKSMSLSKYTNCEITEELIEIIKNNQVVMQSGVSELLKKVATVGKITIDAKREITTLSRDGYVISQTKGDIVSNQNEVVASLRKGVSEIQSNISKSNQELQNGTVKLLYNRARQMGYAVKEERKGTQVQLVLVRSE